MKSSKSGRSGGYAKRSSFYSVACAMALSSLIVLPAFAQRDEGNRDTRQESKSAARGGQQANRTDNRANAPQATRSNAPQVMNGNRGSVVQNSPMVRNSHAVGMRNDRFFSRGPARGTSVRIAPQGGVWRVHNGVRYMYRDGFYYRPYGSSYVVVAPPIGFHIGALPVGFIAFTLANAAYYYYEGAYYQRYNNEYVVVQPPLGALVQSIPEGGQQVVIDGNTFYIVDGVQYQAVMFNGSIWYKVIKLENRVDEYNSENPY